MRPFLYAALVATVLGCTHPSPPEEPAPARKAPSTRVDDARAPARRELSARLSLIEATLLEQAAGARWSELARQRLVLTIALAMLEREAPDRAVVADELVARAQKRIDERDAERARAAGERDQVERELEKRVSEEAARKRDKAEDDLLQGRGEGAERPKPGRKEAHKGGCAPGDPLCGDGGPTPGAPPPPPITGAPEERPDTAVHAARVLPSSHASESEVTALVDRHAERLAACVPQPQRASGMRLEVRVRVDARGRFREPRVLAAEVDPRVSSCITEVFRGMRLEGSEGDSRVVTVPLWLPPQ